MDIDAAIRKGAKHPLGDARVAAHAHANDGNLHHIPVGHNLLIVQLVLTAFQHGDGAVEVRFRYREGHVCGFTVGRNVLDNHVHIDFRFGQWAED